ncbi:Shikimate kinase [Venturia nashicola]|nr:Shikimate kinase [Venturia nashicola]
MLSYDKTPAPTYSSVRSVPASLSSPTLPPATMGKAISRPVQPVHRHLFIVTGPAGCGKSSVAQYLAKSQDFPYIEGDEFHPVSNVEKMAAGIPLNDGDRWDWLIVLREEAVKHLESGAPGVVVTCSALKKKYRDVIRLASLNDHNVIVHFIYLRASEELLMSRVRARQNHYMKDSMVRSQFEALEEPTEKEQDVLTVDVSGTLADVEKLALEAVSQVMANDSAPSMW